MKKYIVRFNPTAVTDIEDSFAWGVRNWGEQEAREWLADLHSTVRKRLTEFPLSCPLAPESAEFGFEIRQLLLGRYRVLYTVRDGTVLVLHLRGAFTE